MILQDILREKGSEVFSIDRKSTLRDVVEELLKHNCGSLVVCRSNPQSPDPLEGIITERDVLRNCRRVNGSLDQVLVQDAMTKNVITGKPGDSVSDAMGIMTTHRVRHLPVVENGALLGMISIGDVVKSQHRAMVLENQYLKTYLQG